MRTRRKKVLIMGGYPPREGGVPMEIVPVWEVLNIGGVTPFSGGYPLLLSMR